MTYSTRLLPSLFSALLGSAALLSACSGSAANFCDDETPCSNNNEVCNPVKNACEAAADAAPDATPAVCEGGNQCVAEVPVDWIGPLAYSTADSMENLAACPSAYMEEVAVVGNQFAETTECGCSCGSISNLSCGQANLKVNNGACPGNLSCLNNSCQQINVPTGSTPSAAPHIGEQVQAAFGAVNGGTCAPALEVSNVTSSFGALSRLCQSASLNASCGVGETCAPQIPAGFVPQQCIAREGEFECPATGPYTERTTLFAEIDDQRECDISACLCETANVSCRGTLITQTPSPINGNAPIEHESTPGCFTVSDRPGIAYNYFPETDVDCRLTGAAVVAGAATPTGATTLCCEPAL